MYYREKEMKNRHASGARVYLWPECTGKYSGGRLLVPLRCTLGANVDVAPPAD